MGLACYLSVHQCDGVVFDDLAALNAELVNKTSVSELIQTDEPLPVDFEGWMSLEASSGDIYFFDREELEYSDVIEVWGCWDEDAAKIIAKHMTAGKLVFHLDIEGNDKF